MTADVEQEIYHDSGLIQAAGPETQPKPAGFVPPADVLLSGDKSTQKRLLLAEGMGDGFVPRLCSRTLFSRLHLLRDPFLWAPRLPTGDSLLPHTDHSALGTRLTLPTNLLPPVPQQPEPYG